MEDDEMFPGTWIRFTPARIKRLQKFKDFRRDLGWSINEALGFLGSFWHEVLDLRESGDITGWTPDYVCDSAGASLAPERVWESLVNRGWLDLKEDGRVLVHDWLSAAGPYLKAKYHDKNRDLLVEIWALYGRSYGKGNQGEGKGIPKGTLRKSTVRQPSPPTPPAGGLEREAKYAHLTEVS